MQGEKIPFQIRDWFDAFNHIEEWNFIICAQSWWELEIGDLGANKVYDLVFMIVILEKLDYHKVASIDVCYQLGNQLFP
jgi:hypothetical protein